MSPQTIVFFSMLMMAHCVNTLVFAINHKDKGDEWRSFSLSLPSVILFVAATGILISTLTS